MSKYEYSNSIPKGYLNLIKDINVEIKQDKFYNSNELHDGYDLDLDCDDTFEFKGLGNLTINCIWNTTKDDIENIFKTLVPKDVNGQEDAAYMFQHRNFINSMSSPGHWFILETIYNKVFRFLGIDGHKSFICADIKHINRNNVFFKHEVIEDYDSYLWATICPGENKYWVKVDTTKLNESEDNSYKLSGRKYTINPDGTISIEDKTNKFVKIRLSVPILNANINIKELKPSDNGFILTSKNGTKQDITMDIVSTVINFVDNGKPGEIKSKNPFKPNIKLTKV
jgi:hypothetical protein